MITTYIYGVPYGFDFYRREDSWNDYFKSYYISSRKGRRLMVNRRSDGLTVYSFLCYQLTEENGRRGTGFFGCSVVLDWHEYSPDFKDLFEWFDYLFNKLVERGGVLYHNKEGNLQYKIRKFNENPDEIEWLRSNLPNIFTKDSGISFLPYDSTYSSRTSGRVVCCNIETPADRLVEEYKKSSWIAISPSFSPMEEVEELSLLDLEVKLNEYNRNILDMAVNPSPEYIPVLTDIENECGDVINRLRKYHNSISDGEEKGKCVKLGESYIKLSDNILTLIGKVRRTLPPVGERQASWNNDNVDPTYDNDSHREDRGVGSGLPEKVSEGEKTLWTKVLGQFNPSLSAAIIIGALLGIIGVIVSVKSCGRIAERAEKGETVVEDVFRKETFYAYLDSMEFGVAFEYVRKYQGSDHQYLFRRIKGKIDSALNKIYSGMTPVEDCQQFIEKHGPVLRDLGYNPKDIVDQANEHKTHLANSEPPQGQSATAVAQSEPEKKVPQITVENKDKSDRNSLSVETVTNSKELEFDSGTYVYIKVSPSLKIQVPDKSGNEIDRLKDGSVKLKLNKTVVITIDNNIKITLKVKFPTVTSHAES